jgi:membrane-bound serine protease (ClpP class)
VNGFAPPYARALARVRSATLARSALSIAALILSVLALGQAPTTPPSTAPSKPGAIPAARQASNVAIITIEGEISDTTRQSVRRRLEIAERAGADAVVFELETPGGSLSAVLAICTEIKACPIRNTVAWVHKTAYSGGAIIAFACREMIVSDPATLGDALIITGIPGFNFSELPQHEQQKMLSPLIAELVDSARRNHYDEMLVQGIASRGVELWLVENKESGQRLFISRAEYSQIFGEAPTATLPTLASAQGMPPSTGAAKPEDPSPSPPTVLPSGPAETRYIPAGPDLNSLSPEISAPTSRPVITSADRDHWTLIEYVSSGAGPFVFKTDQLRHFNLASAIIQNDQELKSFFGAKNLIRLRPTWSEGLVVFLTNMYVKGILVVIFLVGLFVEMTHPGVVAPGAIAFVALVGLVAPPLLIDLSTWWTIAAILGGITLIALEILVLPGFGFPGVIGLLLLFGGLVGTFVPSGSLFPDTPAQRSDLLYGVATLLMATTTAGAIMFFFARHFRTLPVFNRLVLQDPVFNEDEGDDMLAAMATSPVRIGMSGTAVTPLRPAGRVQLGDRIIDVVSEVGYVPAGAGVKITAVSDFRIAVEPA